MDSLADIIKQRQSFAIFSHTAPDGDTLGSAAALIMALQALGKSCQWFCDGEIPHNYMLFSEIKSLVELPSIKHFDVAIAVDCSENKRLANSIGLFSKTPVKAQIDHHITNDYYADINIVKLYTACGLIIMELIDELGVEITKPMAAALYIAICTDTGRLSYEGVDSFTVQKTARLYSCGINIYEITSKLYNMRSFTKSKLIGEALSTLTLEYSGRIAYILLDRQSFARSGSDATETEGIVDYAMEVEGVQVAFMLRCSGEDEYKCSLRCASPYNVANVAKRFNGGGHSLAAGFSFHGNARQALDACLNAVKEEMQEKTPK